LCGRLPRKYSIRSLFGRAERRPATLQTRLNLEILEDRAVPSAATVDLTTAGAQGSINDAIFSQTEIQPTGCGVIHDLLRIQAKSSPIEQGFNTDSRPLQFDEKVSHTFTHSIQLNDVPVVLINGVAYREFLLGINQSSSATVSRPVADLSWHTGRPDRLQLRVKHARRAARELRYERWRRNELDRAQRLPEFRQRLWRHVRQLPDRDFVTTPANPNPFVYLYSKFGVNYGANGGFEQWALPKQTGISPLATVSGYVYFDANNDGTFDAGDHGIAGVTITITGVNDLGVQVTMTTQTDQYGLYEFAGLRPGTYSLVITQPMEYIPGAENVGSLGGVVGFNSINDVVLAANQNGVNYDFGELLFSGS
jgi:hypothetical protein